jgi:Putative abortive phage resistance protein AbiGi, antitoxin
MMDKVQPIALDNGYISDYLVHWTGRTGLRDGFNNLISILKYNRLKLGTNPFVWLDFNSPVVANMVCFTDVPIRHSRIHCGRYGKFGVAFSKRSLANVGAQPVFYYTHSTQQDIKNIVSFLCDADRMHTLPNDIYEALKRHFYFCQEYGKNIIESRDAFYYEREWRLGEDTLEEGYDQDQKVVRRWRAGKSNYFGKIVRDGDNSFFPFKNTDIAFVIIPRRYRNIFSRTFKGRQFKIKLYEDLVNGR